MSSTRPGAIANLCFAGDLSRYREFRLGVGLPVIQALAESNRAQIRLIRPRPNLIQELEIAFLSINNQRAEAIARWDGQWHCVEFARSPYEWVLHDGDVFQKIEFVRAGINSRGCETGPKRSTLPRQQKEQEANRFQQEKARTASEASFRP